MLANNFETANMPTTGASLALKGMQPTNDAFTVARLRQSGALILRKTNMHQLGLVVSEPTFSASRKMLQNLDVHSETR